MKVLKLLKHFAAKIFWHLPVVMLIRMPIKFLKFIVNPKNRMKAFILLTMVTLAVTARILIKKAVERRERLQNRNIFQKF